MILDAWGWCTGTTQREGMGTEEGRGFRMGNTCIPVADSFRYLAKLIQPLWRTVWRFLKKLEIELPCDPVIPLLGIHTEETRRERDMCTPIFIAALFIIARTLKQPRCPSADEWIRKLWFIYTMEYYSAIKKEYT